MKVLVAHPAQQHSYRLASALKEEGLLYKYITTVYYKRFSLTKAVSLLLTGKHRKKAAGRHSPGLNEDDVIQFCEGEGLLKLLALNTRFLKKQYDKIKYHTADRFAKRVAKYAIRHHVDAVVTYDDCSPLLFERLKEQAPEIIRILDMSAANILFMRHIYEIDMETAPDFARRLQRERSICWNPINIERVQREIIASQEFLVPSNFVARSLKYSGVEPEQMHHCPYGVDLSLFALKEYGDELDRKRPIRFIYVGGVKELKGISYLLKAFKQISREKATITVVGNYDAEDEDIQPYIGSVHFVGKVMHSEMPEILRASDVFIFASLGEGFSLSVLEAAACGLPLIITENSGVNDAMTNGKEGFIVPIQSTEALKDKIKWFIEHPKDIKRMGIAARKLADSFSWDAYNHRIATIFTELQKRKSSEDGSNN